MFFCVTYKKTSKNIQNFICEFCDFKCSKRGDWNRHLGRLKHLQLTLGDTQVTKKTSDHKCEFCNKIYYSRNGLWKHKQTCSEKEEDEEMYYAIHIVLFPLIVHLKNKYHKTWLVPLNTLLQLYEHLLRQICIPLYHISKHCPII